MDNASLPTTRGPSELPCGSKLRMTQREMVIELERLAIMYPRTDMDTRKWKVLFDTYWDDLKHLPLGILQDACRSYRRSESNRFFPTSGQLLACVVWPSTPNYDTRPHVPFVPAKPIASDLPPHPCPQKQLTHDKPLSEIVNDGSYPLANSWYSRVAERARTERE